MRWVAVPGWQAVGGKTPGKAIHRWLVDYVRPGAMAWRVGLREAGAPRAVVEDLPSVLVGWVAGELGLHGARWTFGERKLC